MYFIYIDKTYDIFNLSIFQNPNIPKKWLIALTTN